VAEYRIVAKVDPSGVTSGTAKVKQELRGVDAASASTRRSLSQAFEGSGLDKKLDALVRRFDSLEKTMGDVGRTSAAVASSNASVASSLDKLAASGGRAGDGLGKAGKGGQDGARGAAAMEAATRRVLQAVDQEAAELARLNALLADAKMLHDRGVISSTQFARVQTMVTNGVKQQTVSLQQQRAGYMMAGQQVQDWTQQLTLGINPLVVLAQQGGQTASALEMALGRGGTAGRVAAFMAGPWGSLILAATAVIGMMIYKIIQTGEALEKEIDQLKKDAKETEIARQAKERFAKSSEGVAKAIRDATAARKESIAQQMSEAERTNIAARNNLNEEISIRNKTKALIDYQRILVAGQLRRSIAPGERGDMAAIGLPSVQAELDALETRLKQEDERIAEARREYQASRADLAGEAAKRAVDPIAQINRQYDAEVEAAKRAAVATGQVTTALTKQITVIEQRRKAALKAAQDEGKKPPGDGVSRFKSQQQAIGIAGRELQGAGLDVSGNSQFRYTSGHANDADHNRTAIDVNVSANPGRSTGGVREAAVPDLKERFDELARLYQSRGYDVIWNKQFYPAGGNGPSKAAKGHEDHLHIKAPKTIVGKDTQSSTAQQALSEAQRAATAAESHRRELARKAEQERDFVQGVADEAASRGTGSRAESLSARIDRVLADFKRRFDREANPGEVKRITDALTEADAREVATRFDEAYVQPLKRLQALQGKTGLDRQILNEQLEETARLGRELTPIEAERIANSIRQSDGLAREADVLAEIMGPMQAYADRIAALNALLAQGSINQTTYNARVSELGQSARQALADMPGADPATGQSYSDLAARAEEEARYAQELDMFQTQKERLLQMGIDYNALLEAAQRRHVQNMNAIDQARKQMVISSAMSISDSLLSIAEMSAGRQSAIYKAMFVVSKAFAIADAIIKIQQGIANALALPFPANIAAAASVAAAAASIVASIQAVHLNLKDGGYVSGAGGPRDDRIRANLSNGEFVVNSDATSRHRALLEAVNAGTLSAHLRGRGANDNAPALRSGGGDTYSFSFGDVVVPITGNVGREDGQLIGREVKAAIASLVDEKIKDARRSGGALTRTQSSVMAD